MKLACFGKNILDTLRIPLKGRFSPAPSIDFTRYSLEGLREQIKGESTRPTPTRSLNLTDSDLTDRPDNATLHWRACNGSDPGAPADLGVVVSELGTLCQAAVVVYDANELFVLVEGEESEDVGAALLSLLGLTGRVVCGCLAGIADESGGTCGSSWSGGRVSSSGAKTSLDNLMAGGNSSVSGREKGEA